MHDMKKLIVLFWGLLNCSMALPQEYAVIEGICDPEYGVEGKMCYLHGYDFGSEYVIKDSCRISDNRFRLSFSLPEEGRYHLYFPGRSQINLYVAPGDRQRIRLKNGETEYIELLGDSIRKSKVEYIVGTKNAKIFAARDSILSVLWKRQESMSRRLRNCEYESEEYALLSDSLAACRRARSVDVLLRFLTEKPFCESEAICFEALCRVRQMIPGTRFDSLARIQQQRFPNNRSIAILNGTPCPPASEHSKRDDARITFLRDSVKRSREQK